MKKILITLLTICIATTAISQPRTIGMRVGICVMEADYQHNIKKNQFVEAGFGIDFGYNANGILGAKAAASYNFIWARPAWTDKGTWALYAGPGVTMGFVNDEVHYKVGNEVVHFLDNGFMLGICGQVGLEYTFWFPLQLSADLRPVFGMHINDGYTDTTGRRHGTRAGFYDNGILGFVPTISVRYRF